VVRLARIAAVLGLCMLGSWMLLFCFQDRLLFHPQAIPADRRAKLRADADVRALALRTDDGTTVRGWLRHPATPGPWPLLLYFGGNAEDASLILDYADDWPRWAVAVVNYRSYGDSEGKPAEANMKADALRLYDTLAQDPRIDHSRTVLVGRSLGSGVAVAVASARPAEGVVLVTPYDSLPAVGRDVFPWVPVDWLMRNRFPSIQLAPALHVPALFAVAGHDQVIATPHSRRLYDAWAGPKDWVWVDDATHGDILDKQTYQLGLRDFLARCAAASRCRPT